MRRTIHTVCLWGILLSGILMTGCKDKQPVVQDENTVLADSVEEDISENLIEETPMPEIADELFDDFFFNFAANRKLQLSRISFPITYDTPTGKQTINRNDWKMDYFFMPQDFYTLIGDSREQLQTAKDTTLNQAIVERIELNKSTVKQFFFNRNAGIWKLTSIKQESISDNANASFLEFYQQFSTDTLFQAASIAGNATFTAPDPEDDMEEITGTIMPEQWSDFKPEMIPAGTIYNIVYGKPVNGTDQKVFLILGIANGLETQLNFTRKNGKWKLTGFTY